MPAIKAVIETTEGLDEAIAALYTEADGKFVLDVENVEEHPALEGLRKTLPKLRDEVKERDTNLKELKAKLAELEKGSPDAAAMQAKLDDAEAKKVAAEAKASEYQGKYIAATRDQALANELQKAGVTNPTFLRLAIKDLSEKVKVAEDGTVYGETDLGPKVIGEFVKGWASKDGAELITKPQGAGVKGGETMKAKTITRAEFEALNADQRMATVKEGIAIAD